MYHAVLIEITDLPSTVIEPMASIGVAIIYRDHDLVIKVVPDIDMDGIIGVKILFECHDPVFSTVTHDGVAGDDAEMFSRNMVMLVDTSLFAHIQGVL